MAVGPTNVDEAMRAAEEMLAGATGAVEQAGARMSIGKLLAMRGDVEEARRLVRVGLEGEREAGLRVKAAASAMTIAFVEVRAGARDTAEKTLRDGIAELERVGGLSYRGTTALLLADLLAERGAYAEAARWCAEVRETLNEDDLTDVIAVNALEGFLAAQRGEHAEALRLTTRAEEVASTIDMYDHKAMAYQWHARTLALLGKPAKAREAAETALAIYEAKGDIPASAWAQELLDSLSA